MPTSANITTTGDIAFTLPVGTWGVRVINESDTLIRRLLGQPATTSGTSLGLPLAAGAGETLVFKQPLKQAVAYCAIHAGSGNKTLTYEIITQPTQGGTGPSSSAGGGATGDVVGPASSTNGAVALWSGTTGKLLQDSSIFITGGGTIALGGFTLTVPATGTAALLGSVNTFTAQNYFASGVITTSKPAINITQTWNGPGVAFKAIFVNATITAADFGATAFLELQRDSVTQMRIDHGGSIFWSAAGMFADSNVGKFQVPPSGFLSVAGDVNLWRDAAGVAAWRNGTSAQISRLYGTYTDASNYERLSFITAAGAYSIKPEAAGTGTLRDLHISGLPTSNPGPGILWNNLGVVAVGT